MQPIDRTDQRFRICPLIAIFVLGLAAVGCRQNQTPSPTSGNNQGSRNAQDSIQHRPELSGLDILNRTLERYRDATHYADRGVLYLSYRLEGRPIQEPQPWSVVWNDGGKFAAEWFNSNVRCDGNQLSCYIYDIESGNLDNQQLILEGAPLIKKLVSDEIANHFISGQSEMPFRAGKGGESRLLPPPLTMLSGQLLPIWMSQPTSVERKPDGKIDKRNCYVIACNHESKTWELWIDHDLGLLWQVVFPVELLDQKVLESADVDEIQLVARFHAASFSRPITPDQFAVQLMDNSTLVRKFVKLPEAMPSELIGAQPPTMNLLEPGGKNVEAADWDGKLATFVWVAGDDNRQLLEQYAGIANKFKGNEFHFSLVYSDTQLWKPGTGSYQPNVQIRQFSDRHQIPVYYDQILDASTALQLKALPAVVILNNENKIQFAATLKGNSWDKSLAAALERISNGEDLASEMIHKYQQYLEQYHQELLANGINSNRITNGSMQQVSKSTRRKMNLVKEWSSDQLQQPGNIVVTHSPDDRTRVFAFDGWRTLVEFDENGNLLARQQLDLPDGTGAGVLRTALDRNGRRWFAVFMKYGSGVYVFDSQWELTNSYPPAHVEFGKITDCQFAAAEDGEVKLFVAFNRGGIHRMDLESGRNQTVSQQIVDSLGKRLDLGTANGKLVEFWGSDPDSQQALKQWQFRRVLQTEDETCGLAVGPDQNYYAVGLDFDLKQKWSISVGSQNFESPIEPMKVVMQSGYPVWAIADADHGIHFVNHEGKWIGDYQSEQSIQGFDFTVKDQAISLYVATAGEISKWHLSPVESPLLPASGPQRLRTSLRD